jgi:predicted NBD/HSP70 family sugar kinase
MKGILTQSDIKESNLAEVLKIVLKDGPLTRRELEKKAGLSWGGTSQIVARLLEQEYLIETVGSAEGPGRRPNVLEINGRKHLVLGIDINISGITAVIQNLKGEELDRRTGKSRISGREEMLESIWNAADPLFQKFSKEGILVCGISMQGKVDEASGISLEVFQIPGWANVPLTDIFEERYRVPSFIAHDPDCLVASDVSLFGQDVILFRLDYDIGMSVFKSGNFLGRSGMLETGSLKLYGVPGVVRDYLTIPALEKKTGMAVQSMEQTVAGKEAVLEAAGYFSCLAENCSILFDVPKILICGDLVDACPSFFEEVRSALVNGRHNRNMQVFHYDVKRAASGAAFIAQERRFSGEGMF